jgi:hypothetical protein
MKKHVVYLDSLTKCTVVVVVVVVVVASVLVNMKLHE